MGTLEQTDGSIRGGELSSASSVSAHLKDNLPLRKVADQRLQTRADGGAWAELRETTLQSPVAAGDTVIVSRPLHTQSRKNLDILSPQYDKIVEPNRLKDRSLPLIGCYNERQIALDLQLHITSHYTPHLSSKSVPAYIKTRNKSSLDNSTFHEISKTEYCLQLLNREKKNSPTRLRYEQTVIVHSAVCVCSQSPESVDVGPSREGALGLF
ncbi:hypothetical protein M758_UG178100 [Ceratodon purpureus]|nr:hypothetical protein M758_UG178100 [Ceratodon purpureus]